MTIYINTGIFPKIFDLKYSINNTNATAILAYFLRKGRGSNFVRIVALRAFCFEI